MPVSSVRVPDQVGKKERMSMPLAALMVPPPVPPLAPNEKLRAVRYVAVAAAAAETGGTPVWGGGGVDADHAAASPEVAGEGEVWRGGGQEDAARAAAVLHLLAGGEL